MQPLKSKGFTLVEMLVAITILSMVMLATVTGLRTLANSQTSLVAQSDRNDALRSASSFLRDAFESAVIGRDVGGLSLGGGGRDRTVFEAGPERLMWKTSMRFGESAGGSFVANLARAGDVIELRWQKMAPNGELAPWNNAPARTLVQNVDEFAVAYRRVPGGEWQEVWDGRGAPAWVRLRIKAQGRYWPDIVMQVAR